MKNKNNQNYSNQQNQPKQNFYKNRNQHYQKNNYHQNYKTNLNKNGYYDNKSYWNDGYDFNDIHNIRQQEHWNYKKKQYYNNYKKREELSYDEEDLFQFPQYTERGTSPPKKYKYNFQDERKDQVPKGEELLNVEIKYKGRKLILTIYKEANVNEAVTNFVKENQMEERFHKPLLEKIKNSLKEVENIKASFINEDNIKMINKLDKLYNGKDE